MKNVFYLVLSALCLFTACSDDDDKVPSVTKIILSQNTLSVAEGGTGVLTATFEPQGASAVIEWESSNIAVASVTSGAIIGVTKGVAVITAKVGAVSAACVVTVVDSSIKPTDIEISKTTLSINVGSTETLTAALKPDGAPGTITWTSSTPTIATVTNGVVTGISEGTAVITATCEGLAKTCVVTVLPVGVVPPKVTGISLNKNAASITKGATETLIATLQPANAQGTITWTSSAPTIASVNNGLVTALNEGTTVITAACEGFTATCTVTVTGIGGEANNYYVLFLDPTSYETIKGKVKYDLRPDDATAVLDIWPDGSSYTAVNTSGPNSNGHIEGWIALQVNQNPWAGVGAGGIRQTKSFDLTGIDGTYTFHCAYKSKDGGKNEVCLFSEDGSETWKVLPSKTDGEWHEYEIPMSQFISSGWSFPRPYTLSGDGRYTLGFRSTGVGTILELDAVYIYKK